MTEYLHEGARGPLPDRLLALLSGSPRVASGPPVKYAPATRVASRLGPLLTYYPVRLRVLYATATQRATELHTTPSPVTINARQEEASHVDPRDKVTDHRDEWAAAAGRTRCLRIAHEQALMTPRVDSSFRDAFFPRSRMVMN